MNKLVALVDGSIYSRSVCDHAAWIAQRTGAAVELLHVIGRGEAGSTPTDLSGSIALGARTALLEELSALDEQRAKLAQKRGRAILEDARDILEAAGAYLHELPVDRYVFLFHFEDVTMGALEHSYSSTYTFAESEFDQLIREAIPDIVAHEFLHIVTPLNIHSDVIEHFNFVEPTPSEHVWLYEGVTEWMAHVSQLRGGLIGQHKERLRVQADCQRQHGERRENR